MRWCSFTSSAQASSSRAAHRWMSAASRPPTSVQVMAANWLHGEILPPSYHLSRRPLRLPVTPLEPGVGAKCSRPVLRCPRETGRLGDSAADRRSRRPRSTASSCREREPSYRQLRARGGRGPGARTTPPPRSRRSAARSRSRPTRWLAHLKRGEAYRRRGEFDAAVRDLRRAAEIDPRATQPARAARRRALCASAPPRRGRADRFSRAVERYRESVALDDRSRAAPVQAGAGRATARGSRRRRVDALRQAARPRPALRRGALRARPLRSATRASRGARRASLERAVELAPALLRGARGARRPATARRRAPRARCAQLEALVALEPAPARERRARPGLRRARVSSIARSGRWREPPSAIPTMPRLYVALGGVLAGARIRPATARQLRKAIEALAERRRAATAGSDALTLFGRALLMAADVALRRADRCCRRTQRFRSSPTAFRYLADAAERRGHAATSRASGARPATPRSCRAQRP